MPSGCNKLSTAEQSGWMLMQNYSSGGPWFGMLLSRGLDLSQLLEGYWQEKHIRQALGHHDEAREQSLCGLQQGRLQLPTTGITQPNSTSVLSAF